LFLKRFFLGQRHKIIKKKNISNINYDNSETHDLKCKAEDVEKILSEKKGIFQQPRYEKR